MKTFEIQTQGTWGDKWSLNVAAKTFREACVKVRQVMKKKLRGQKYGRRYRITSFIEIAQLDA